MRQLKMSQTELYVESCYAGDWYLDHLFDCHHRHCAGTGPLPNQPGCWKVFGLGKRMLLVVVIENEMRDSERLTTLAESVSELTLTARNESGNPSTGPSDGGSVDLVETSGSVYFWADETADPLPS